MRCTWAEDPLMVEYHDKEWGVPVHDDNKLFEFLLLESMQAGLSWMTILKKRENFRRAFSRFDPEQVALYSGGDIERLLADPGIIRNGLKISAAINNARRVLQVQKEFGTFDRYLWQFVDGRPIRHSFRSLTEIPARSAESDAMSKDMTRRGFKFVGSTICYAFMQAVGMVNDHCVDCFRYQEVSAGY